MSCAALDCDRAPEYGSDYCPAHRKRLQRGRPLAAPLAPRYPSAWARVYEACIALADCDSADDQAWTRACDRLRKAVAGVIAKASAARRSKRAG